jgi:mannosyl-oligosaccharide alpha-1,2-mannosidase
LNSFSDFIRGAARNWGWSIGHCSILAEFGTLHLEFSYLTEITGDPVYINKVKKVRELLKTLEKPNGLYVNYLRPTTGQWCGQHTSLGAFGDSFYEYLLKSWIQTSRHDAVAREMYDEAMKAVVKHLVKKSRPSKLTYLGEMYSSSVGNTMEHLVLIVVTSLSCDIMNICFML